MFLAENKLIALGDKKVNVHYCGDLVPLTPETQISVDAHYESIINSGRQLMRGDVFHRTGMYLRGDSLSIHTSRTDYAHYLWSQDLYAHNHEQAVHVCHTASILLTSDNHILLGRMSRKRAGLPGCIQAVGGTLDASDLRGNTFDTDFNATREIREETGIDVNNPNIASSFGLKFIRYDRRGHKVALIYEARLQICAQEFRDIYNLTFNGSDNLPEFDEIFLLPLRTQDINQFLNTHTLRSHYVEDILDHYGSSI